MPISGSVPCIVDDNDVTPSGPYEPASLVGVAIADRYLVQRVVSTGSSTALFDATDRESGRVVHLKLVRPALAASPSFRERFTERMAAVSALSHPNIAAVYDYGIASVGDTSTAFVVIEHLTGGSLRDMFDRGRRLSPSQALAVGLDTCRALDYAHRRGFIHSEVNPSKIVFGDDRRLRVVDFGLAKLLGDAVWANPEQVPTHVAWYAAPEQAEAGEVDGKADVYALCLTLTEAITGQLPFKSDSTVNTLANRVGKLMPVTADMGALASVLERAGRPEPAERSSAAQFGKSLVQAASKMRRPEPLPLLSVGLFDTPAEQLRKPDDPTGGLRRPGEPQPPTEPLLVVPVDEPSPADAEIAPTEPTPSSPPPDAAPAEPGAPTPRQDVVPEESARAIGDDPADNDDGLVIVPLDAAIGDRPRPPITEAQPGIGSTPVQSAPTATMPAYEEPPKRRGRTVLKVLLGLLLIGAFVGLGVAAAKTFRTTTDVVPDLVGDPAAEAQNLISANGWEVTVERERSDVVPKRGHVVRTAPEAGVDLAEGDPFLIVVSEGPTLRELPEVFGQTLAEAQQALVDEALRPNVVEAFDEQVPKGTVISWSVPGDPTLTAGAEVEPGTEVELVLSKGPEPRTVPNILQIHVDDARAMLSDLKLGFEVTKREFNDDVEEGHIISQSFAEGETVERGTKVTAVVSKGVDLVEFPDLGNVKKFRQVKNRLEKAGFKVELVFGASDGTEFTFEVGGEEANPGDEFKRGSKVDVTAL